MRDLDELALAMPETTRDVSDDGRRSYVANGKAFVFHRSQRPDAIDAETGERLADVLVFHVADLEEKEIRLADGRGIYFTTPHFNGYRAVLVRIPQLTQLDRAELADLVIEAWLARAPKRLAKTWLAEHGLTD
jgi:hypothetical protein